MKRITFLLLSILLLLVSCSKEDYTRDETAGEYIRISYADLKDKVLNNEDFMVLFTQAECEHCKGYKEDVLSPYLASHNVPVYEFILSEEENYSQELFTEIQNYTVSLTEDVDQQFMGTPYTMIVEEGELKEGISGSIEENTLEKLVKKYRLDELKTYTRSKEAGTIEVIDFKTLQAKIENDDSFYVLFTQDLCTHCKEFKENVLYDYLKGHRIHVYEFVLSNEKNYSQEVFDSIKEYVNTLTLLPQQWGTPYSMVVRAGNVSESFTGAMSEDLLEEMVMKYKLDQEK